MPRDAKGNFHLNTQRMLAHGDGKAKPAPAKEPPMHDGAHEDAQEHEPGSIHEHLAQMHAEHGGKHMHIHHGEDGSITSHHVGEDGHVEGPHDHENIEALKDHMGRFLDEEENEYTDNQHQEHEGHEPEYA